MINDIKILKQHGKQFIPDIRRAALPEIFRGRPVISDEISSEEALKLVSLCPVKAIQYSGSLSLDLGRCVFCKECEFASSGKIKFTNDYKMAVNDRNALIITAGKDIPMRIDPGKLRKDIRRVFRRSLKLRQVSAAGDNSCEMELNAAGNVNFDMGRFGIEFVASPRHADGVVVTGPVSKNMADALQITWEAVPSPKIFILAGTDAISGGVFSNSPALDRNFPLLDKADLYIPGNPMHPLSFIHGILDLLGR